MKPPPIALFYSTCKKSNVSVLSKKFKKHLEILIDIAFLVTEVGATPGVVAALLTSIAAEILAFDTITIIRTFLHSALGLADLGLLADVAFLVTEVGATPGVVAALLTSIAAEILAFDTITVIRLGLGNGNGRKGSDSQKNANFCHCRFLFSLLESFSELFLRHQINLPHSFQIFD